jgi:hypothetical protein
VAMSRKLPIAALFLSVAGACTWAAGCSSNDATPAGGDSGAANTGGGSGSGSGSSGGSSSGSSSGAPRDAGGADAAEGGGLGLLVDNMTATTGTRASLVVPADETPGSYYTYFLNSFSSTGLPTRVTATSSLGDVPVTPVVVNPDGSQIVGKLCFGGSVVDFAGLGMSLAYGSPPDASPEAGSSPVPFDASHYSGVSFYILGNAPDASISTVHFSVPDTQTADPQAWATSVCAETEGGVCDDDFGADVPYVPGQWTKVAFKWDALSEQGFGLPPFSALRTGQLIGMKWQVNGGGVDASIETFNFCISDIYFTP